MSGDIATIMAVTRTTAQTAAPAAVESGATPFDLVMQQVADDQAAAADTAPALMSSASAAALLLLQNTRTPAAGKPLVSADPQDAKAPKATVSAVHTVLSEAAQSADIASVQGRQPDLDTASLVPTEAGDDDAAPETATRPKQQVLAQGACPLPQGSEIAFLVPQVQPQPGTAQSGAASPQVASDLPDAPQSATPTSLQEQSAAESLTTPQETPAPAAPMAKTAPTGRPQVELTASQLQGLTDAPQATDKAGDAPNKTAADASQLPTSTVAQPVSEKKNEPPDTSSEVAATTSSPPVDVVAAAVLAQLTPAAGNKDTSGEVPAVTGDGRKTKPDIAKDGGKNAPADPAPGRVAASNSAPASQAAADSAPARIAADNSAPATQASVNGTPAPVSIPSASATGQAAVPPLQAAAQQLPTVPAEIQVAPQHHDFEITATTEQLGLAIAAKSVDGVRHFDIRLDPPELGRVQVQLSVDDSGKAHANLVVDKPQTLELLQRDAANLNRTLTDAGLNLPNNGLNFTLREQYRQNDGDGVDKGRSRPLSVTAVVQPDASQTRASIGSFAPHSVRLDIRV
jgi:flagellar hook-length control protein FliK